MKKPMKGGKASPDAKAGKASMKKDMMRTEPSSSDASTKGRMMKKKGK